MLYMFYVILMDLAPWKIYSRKNKGYGKNEFLFSGRKTK